MVVRRIEEMSDMNGTKQAIEAMGSRRVPLLRMASAVLAAGGLSAAVLAADTAGAATSSVVSTTKTSKYGTILVSGKTVYTLKASSVACGSGCLKIWPEVLLPKGVTMATAGSGVNAASLGTVAGTGGALQVTYGGKPLYWFFKDTRPGQVGGNITDKWGKWSVVVTVRPAHGSSGSGGTPTTSSGSGGVSF
jgi:predicted lipoprotein with Yx(FWY)xxD motif